MGRPELSLDQARLRETLIAMLDCAMPACAQVEYCLVGTAAALLHGVELRAGDVDILLRERAGVEAIGATLSAFRSLSPPSLLPGGKQYFASYDLDGVKVELSTVEAETEADTFEVIGDGPWKHFTLIPCGSHEVPTVSLELRLITELARQRPDRYEPIIRHMQAKGCDVAFVSRGMISAGLPQEVRENTLKQLEGKGRG
jgi:hypothetical protein